MCALDHPYIVQFYGISLSPENKLYLVMELMQQGNLRHLLDKKGENLPWKLRLKFALNAAKGMSYLHEHQIIHRDLKPHNLLVNENWRCKVADFGISTHANESVDNSTADNIGTPYYMAPERFNSNYYSEKVDVYAFGVLLCELYTGTRPYSDLQLTQQQIIYKVCNEDLRPDISVIPATLAQLINDCWNPRPKLRPSFLEIIVRLRRLRALTLPSTKPTTDDEDIRESKHEEEEDEDEKRPLLINSF